MKYIKTICICTIIILICFFPVEWCIAAITEGTTINENLSNTVSFTVSSNKNTGISEDMNVIIKESLIDEISTQIHRSERIVKAFSVVEQINHKEEYIAIIERNESKLEQFKKLLSELEAISADDYDSISSIYDDFSEATMEKGVDTSISGTVFIYKSVNNEYHAKIAANFNIDKRDWGGIAFYFPEGIHISNIDCSYPEEVPLKDKTHNDDYDYINVDYSGGNKYYSKIEIARNIDEIPSGGGSGMVLIDLDIDKAKLKNDNRSILVCVGCGIHGVETDSVEVKF